MSTGPETEALRRAVDGYLKAHNTMTIASASDGRPWTATVFYAHLDFLLYFLSSPDSRHSRELASNPRVAATITEDYREWRRIKGVQLEGTAEPVRSRRERASALSAYVAKFPFVVSFFPSGSWSLSRLKVGGRGVSVRLYRIVPERLLFLDNEKGFHHREELILRGP